MHEASDTGPPMPSGARARFPSTLVAGETAVRVTEQTIQVLGGNGYTRDCPVERWHRDAKIAGG
jgi:alkylation response protein AidB-like acyl-CoA dehydrogenase